MKKFLLACFVLVASTISTSFGCEICGCGNSNFQIGMLPYYQNGFVGLRYSTSQFHSHVRGSDSEFSRDNFKMAEVWGGYNTGKFQFMGFMPYFSSRKVSDDGVTTSQGAGDAMILVNYRLHGSVSLIADETVSIRHDVYVGGGIKFPTGVSHVDTTNPDFNIGDFNSQAGTGSMDYLLNATHNVMWNKSGVVTNVAYRFNTANKQDYRFGNRAYLNSSYFYTLTFGKTKVKPNVGVSYQSNAVNVFQGQEVEDSNGYIFNSSLGVNVLCKKIGFNATGFLPISQNMYAHQTKLSSRLLVGVTYSF